jgi:hypothetical protein
MTKTTTRRDGPGLARLRKAANAETIRAAVLSNQETGRAEALAKIEAEKAADAEAIDLPAGFTLGAPQTAADGPQMAPARVARPVSAPRRPAGPRAERLSLAQAGVLPAPPDFTAESYRRFRGKLAAVIALVEVADVNGLRAYRHDGFMGSSMKAVLRYRDLALVALEARTAKAA